MNPLEPWILIVFSGPKKGGIAWGAWFICKCHLLQKGASSSAPSC